MKGHNTIEQIGGSIITTIDNGTISSDSNLTLSSATGGNLVLSGDGYLSVLSLNGTVAVVADGGDLSLAATNAGDDIVLTTSSTGEVSIRSALKQYGGVSTVTLDNGTLSSNANLTLSATNSVKFGGSLVDFESSTVQRTDGYYDIVGSGGLKATTEARVVSSGGNISMVANDGVGQVNVRASRLYVSPQNNTPSMGMGDGYFFMDRGNATGNPSSFYFDGNVDGGSDATQLVVLGQKEGATAGEEVRIIGDGRINTTDRYLRLGPHESSTSDGYVEVPNIHVRKRLIIPEDTGISFAHSAGTIPWSKEISIWISPYEAVFADLVGDGGFYAENGFANATPAFELFYPLRLPMPSTIREVHLKVDPTRGSGTTETLAAFSLSAKLFSGNLGGGNSDMFSASTNSDGNQILTVSPDVYVHPDDDTMWYLECNATSFCSSCLFGWVRIVLDIPEVPLYWKF